MIWKLLLPALILSGCTRPNPEPTYQPPTPQEVLERLDDRIPVPLLAGMIDRQNEIMRDRLVVIQEIVTALATDDFNAVLAANERIAMSSGKAEMCHHMGEGAASFGDVGRQFHTAADEITVAAQNKDRKGVLKALGSAMAHCNGCHQTYKQQLVDDKTRSAAIAKVVEQD